MLNIRLAFRHLRRSPGFSFVAIGILALGIGAVTVMFSVLSGTVLRPLSFADPARLVRAQALTDKGQNNSLSALDYWDYRAQCTAFESLAAQSIWQPGRVVTGRGEPERVRSSTVSHNFFSTLGSTPHLGRSFLEEDEIAGAAPVVVVSDGLWREKFGTDPSTIGSEVVIDGTVHRIVGVAPAGFGYPGNVRMWLPMRHDGSEESGRGNNNFIITGRLAPGIDITQANTQMAAVAARIAAENPSSKAGWSTVVRSLREAELGGSRTLLVMLMGATVLLLLIACANVSSLLLARVMARRGEIAVRFSLGASTACVVRQLLAETLVLTTLAATAGIGLATIGVRAVRAFGPASLPRLDSVAIDGRALVMAVAAAILATVLAGVVPALRGSRVDLSASLRGSGRSTETRRHQGLRQALVTSQVALSFVLLVVTGLLLHSATRLQQVDPGFDLDGLLTVSAQIPAAEDAGPQVAQRFATILERVRAVPGVTTAAAADQLPLFGGPWNGIHRADQPPQSSSDLLPATRRIVTTGFFHTLGIPLLAGRDFEATDTPEQPFVTIISETFAKRLFPGENPIGRVLNLPWGSGIPLQIVGVVGDVRDFGPAADFRPAFYLSFGQHPSPPAAMRLVVRGPSDPTVLVPAIRTVIHDVESEAPLYAITTLEERLAGTTASSRFSAGLLSLFGVVATLLATAGLFGLMSYSVAQRTHEIGIRLALGARRESVLRLVARQGLVLAAIGIVAGVGSALLVSRLLTSLLYGTSPSDPASFALAIGALAASALIASLVPAWRATKVDPIIALRAE